MDKTLKTSVSHMLKRPKVTLFRMLWQFHHQDKDPFPSVPHGHSMNPYDKYKLNVFNGDVIEVATRSVKGRASKKELNNLYRDKEFQRVAIATIAYYLELHPEANLPLLPFMEQRNKRRNILIRRKRYEHFRARHIQTYKKRLLIEFNEF